MTDNRHLENKAPVAKTSKLGSPPSQDIDFTNDGHYQGNNNIDFTNKGHYQGNNNEGVWKIISNDYDNCPEGQRRQRLLQATASRGIVYPGLPDIEWKNNGYIESIHNDKGAEFITTYNVHYCYKGDITPEQVLANEGLEVKDQGFSMSMSMNTSL